MLSDRFLLRKLDRASKVPLLSLVIALATMVQGVQAQISAQDGVGNQSEIKSFFEFGLGIFRFGMTPDEVNVQLPIRFKQVEWSSLPVAREYKNDDIRYFWVHISNFLNVRYYNIFSRIVSIYPLSRLPSCISEPSYIVFLFKQRYLFHISLRAIADRKCNDYSNLFLGFTDYFKLPIAHSEDKASFAFETSFLRLIGTITPRGVVLDMIKPGIAGTDGDQNQL